MRVTQAAIGITLVLLLGTHARLMAQQEGGWQTRGMFGDRTLGQPLRPAPSGFSRGLQYGPSGEFLGVGRPDGSNMFATPWRQVQPVLPAEYSALAPPVAPARTLGPQSLPPELMPPAAAGQQEAIPETPFGSGSVQGEQSGEAGAVETPSGAALGGTGQPAWGWAARTAAAGAGRASAASYRVDPELSARLTRIARTKGITTPGGITVSVGNGTAVLRGVVSTPDARVLLAKVARLEPRIGQIDNQLRVSPSQNNPADRP